MKGCGALENIGHGANKVCGEVFYHKIWICDKCILKEAYKTIIEMEKSVDTAHYSEDKIKELQIVIDKAKEYLG